MGKIKHIQKVRDYFKKTHVAHIRSIKNIIQNEKYAHLLIHQMLKKKEIYRIAKGWYSLSQDPTLVVFCFKPSYLGLQEALSIHNLWEQETNTIVITTQIIREGLRKINESNVIMKRIPPSLFFGLEYKRYGNIDVPVSDIEKTVLDMFYFKQPIDKELLHTVKKKIDIKKLKAYSKRFPASTRKLAEKILKM
ncbi:MAG TPA: hypothetical protein VJK72_03340 [Candidatus Nanoarchaeia archaeon]|nr:hypothetical protein [Candidatus Nanoarchaeia archaeon]